MAHQTAAEKEEHAFREVAQAVQDMTWDEQRSRYWNFRRRVKLWQVVMKHAQEAMFAAVEAARVAQEGEK